MRIKHAYQILEDYFGRQEASYDGSSHIEIIQIHKMGSLHENLSA